VVNRTQTSTEPVKLGALFAVLYFVQGMGELVAGLVAQPVRSLLRSWGDGAAYIAAFSAAVSIPKTLKPLYGFLSDFVPFAELEDTIKSLADLQRIHSWQGHH
jgi:hypothetical protein